MINLFVFLKNMNLIIRFYRNDVKLPDIRIHDLKNNNAVTLPELDTNKGSINKFDIINCCLHCSLFCSLIGNLIG